MNPEEPPVKQPPVLQYAREDRGLANMLAMSRAVHMTGKAAFVSGIAVFVVPLMLVGFWSRLAEMMFKGLIAVTILLWLVQAIFYLVWMMHALVRAERRGREVPAPAIALLLHLIPVIHLTGPMLVFSHLTAAPPGSGDLDEAAYQLRQGFRGWLLLWLAFWALPVLAYQAPGALLLWLPVAIGLPLMNARLVRLVTESLHG